LKTIEVARKLQLWQKTVANNEGIAMAELESSPSGLIALSDDILMPLEDLFLGMKEMDDLPPFSVKTTKTWWKIAHEIFLKVTNKKPWTFPELKSYANSSRVDANATGKKFDGVMLDGVVKAVKKAFFDLASSEE
jgi:hypothetical protein